jgi:hypothetical protein
MALKRRIVDAPSHFMNELSPLVGSYRLDGFAQRFNRHTDLPVCIVLAKRHANVQDPVRVNFRSQLNRRHDQTPQAASPTAGEKTEQSDPGTKRTRKKNTG